LGVGQRGLKNDQRDARTLSKASCRIELPSVHIPSAVSQEVKAICVSREALIKARTQLVSRVRSYVRSRLGQPLRATPASLPKNVRRALLLDADGLPADLERLLVTLETLSQQIADADSELKELACEDARMRRLMTVPGVGPVTLLPVRQDDRVGDLSRGAALALYRIAQEAMGNAVTARRSLTFALRHSWLGFAAACCSQTARKGQRGPVLQIERQ
jgi:transposase